MGKAIFGFVLMIIAAVVGVYLAGWILALGGVSDIMNLIIRKELVDRLTLLWPVAKILISGIVAIISFFTAGFGGWMIVTAVRDALAD